MEKPSLVIIAGPTAVGKTATSIKLAKQFNAEIINADSRQVYRFLNIGTAKPTLSERSQVPHHLVDIVNPDEPFNAARFAELAREKISELEEKNKKVFVVGGTGLYIRALIHGLFQGPKGDRSLRDELEREAASSGIQLLHKRLATIDPESSRRIHPNDRHRIIRALEVFLLTGKSIVRFQEAHNFEERPYRTLKIVLSRPRRELYDRIDKRVCRMFGEGLIDEVRGLIKSGYGPNLPSMTSIGYHHVVSYLEGKISLERASELLQRDTRRYAKRQLTWFKGDKEYQWHSPDEFSTLTNIIANFYRPSEEIISQS